jgi:hypothetical protein
MEIQNPSIGVCRSQEGQAWVPERLYALRIYGGTALGKSL